MILIKKYNLEFRELKQTDTNKLKQFCNECANLNYLNNNDFERLRLKEMFSSTNRYFIGYDLQKNKIFNLAGVHKMFENNNTMYRLLYRGATLPGYSTGLFGAKSSWQLMLLINMQVDYILNFNKTSEFYLTTNLEKTSNNGKSDLVGSILGPRVSKHGFLKCVNENFYYRSVYQKLWKLDVKLYKEWVRKSNVNKIIHAA